MKYFTREELEDITKELIENPTRETLKNLNEKYNGTTVTQELSQTIEENPVVESMPAVGVEEQPVVAMPNEVVEEKPVMPAMDIALPPVVETPVVTPLPIASETPAVQIPGINMQSFKPQKVEVATNIAEPSIQVPSFELPKLETPTFNNQNNELVNFNGNLFDKSVQEIGNLMQTTDNFNVTQNVMPNTEVPVAPAPFFISSPENINNTIPVGGPSNSMSTTGPSMFGQLEQNYI